jgi:hypothetical protein
VTVQDVKGRKFVKSVKRRLIHFSKWKQYHNVLLFLVNWSKCRRGGGGLLTYLELSKFPYAASTKCGFFQGKRAVTPGSRFNQMFSNMRSAYLKTVSPYGRSPDIYQHLIFFLCCWPYRHAETWFKLHAKCWGPYVHWNMSQGNSIHINVRWLLVGFQDFYTFSCCNLLDTRGRELQTAFLILVEICLALIGLETCFTYSLPSETNFIRISLSYLSYMRVKN